MSVEVEDAQIVEEVVDMNEVIKKSSVTADALLATDGWSILRELHISLSHAINATSVIVIPATQNAEMIRSKVSDPVAFSNIMHNAVEDIGNLARALAALGHIHLENGKTEVLPEDLDQITDLSMKYTNIHGHLDNSVRPLLLSLVEVLKEADIDTEAFLGDKTDE